MTHEEVAKAVKAAERSIAVILRDLEQLTGANVSREAALMTDEAAQYKKIGEHFLSHDSVNHGANEYVNPIRPWIHTSPVPVQ